MAQKTDLRGRPTSGGGISKTVQRGKARYQYQLGKDYECRRESLGGRGEEKIASRSTMISCLGGKTGGKDPVCSHDDTNL